MQNASAAAAAGSAFCSEAWHTVTFHSASRPQLTLNSIPLHLVSFFRTFVFARNRPGPRRAALHRVRVPHLQPLPFTATSAAPTSDNIIIRTSVSRHPNAKVSSAGAACNTLNADASATSRPGVQSKTSQTCSPWKRQTSRLRPNNLTLAMRNLLFPCPHLPPHLMHPSTLLSPSACVPSAPRLLLRVHVPRPTYANG